MIIDGKAIADTILQQLREKTAELKRQNITSTLAVFFVGNDPGSTSYVRQKQKTAEAIEAALRLFRYPISVHISTINKTIQQCNNDPLIHGIIIQRPLPKHLQGTTLLHSIRLEKDVDGFIPGSKFRVPVAMAIETILEKIYQYQRCHPDPAVAGEGSNEAFRKAELDSSASSSQTWLRLRMTFHNEFQTWLTTQRIVIIGRGETAGKPIADHLIKQGCDVFVIHSQTSNQDKQTHIKGADIVISCVGKQRVITPADIKKGVILISVGLSRDPEGKLHGDYEEDDIKDIASFYTPTPGGVGPINVACLMQNLISAANQ